MKIYVLVILMSFAFGGIRDEPIVVSVVSNPEEAAILLKRQRDGGKGCERPSFEGILYLIDTNDMAVKSIPIPEIKFINKEEKK